MGRRGALGEAMSEVGSGRASEEAEERGESEKRERGGGGVSLPRARSHLNPTTTTTPPAPTQGGAITQNSGPDPFEVSDADTMLAYLRAARK